MAKVKSIIITTRGTDSIILKDVPSATAQEMLTKLRNQANDFIQLNDLPGKMMQVNDNEFVVVSFGNHTIIRANLGEEYDIPTTDKTIAEHFNAMLKSLFCIGDKKDLETDNLLIKCDTNKIADDDKAYNELINNNRVDEYFNSEYKYDNYKSWHDKYINDIHSSKDVI